MKNICKYLFCLMFLLPSLYSVAQSSEITVIEETEKKVQFDIRGGLNINNMQARYKSDYENFDSKLGYNIGLYANFSLKNNWFMQSGLSLTSKGAKFDDSGDELSIEALYLQVPVYVGYRSEPLGSSNLRLRAALGPYFAYGIGGKITIDEGRGREQELDTFGSKGTLNNADVGLGCEVALEKDRFIFMLSTEYGITNAWKRKLLDNSDLSVHNQTVMLSIGFKL